MAELISEKDVRLKVAAGDWKEAIKKCGELLVENHYVEDRYVTAMIETAKELGPYIVMAPGVAMPHARNTDGVIKSGLSIITLEHPVNFGNPDNDPVSVVVGLAGSSDETHIMLLQAIASVFGEEGTASKIAEEYTVEDIVGLFNR